MNSGRPFGVLVAFVVIASTQPSFAQSTITLAPAKSVDVMLQMGHTAKGGAFTMGGSATTFVAPGASDAGLFAFAGDTPCSLGVGAGESSPAEIERLDKMPLRHWWKVEIRMLTASLDTISMEVTLRHETRGADGHFTEVSREVRSLKLAENEPHILIYVDGRPGDSTCDNANALVEIEAAIHPDTLADRRVNYSLWLVQRDSDGHQINQRRDASAYSGDNATVTFDPVRWQEGVTCGVRMTVVGTVHGRARADGRFDVSLTVTAKQAGPGIGFGGGVGRKSLTIGPGEPLEVTLADLPRYLKTSCPSGPPSMIVTVEAAR